MPDINVLLILYIAIYSVMGWICETVYCSLLEKKLVKRGFLEGPYCPIYGFGAFFILWATHPFVATPPMVFFVAMLVAGILEYFVSWLLEVLFHMRWWDYSQKRFQINGRVCLENCVYFGLLGLFLTYTVHPFLSGFLGGLPTGTRAMLASAILLVVSVDFIHSVGKLLNLKGKLRGFHQLLQELETYNEQYEWYDRKDIEGSLARLRDICAQHPDDAMATEILTRLDKLADRRDRLYRMLNAYPTMRSRERGKELKAFRQYWLERRRKGESS